jgi:predicted signal transduction protein with EAL and GGDEF domain
VARLGGDEFAVLLPDTGVKGAIHLSQKLLNALNSPFVVEGHHLKVGISIGIAVFPEHGLDSETLLQRADVAMYVAKRGNLGFSIYDAEQDQYTLNRLTLIGKLHDAMQAQQLELYYQPIVDINTHRVWGVEALTRWPHPELGFISPVDFIPMAEQSGNIRQLTQWVIKTVIHQIQQWENAGNTMRVSINLSVKDIQDEQFASQISSTLQETNIDTRLLTFEITEGSMMTDSERAHQTITRLHDSGSSIAIDDFGTGFSSLSYLKQLPAKHIKIDKSFIMDMLDDDNDAIIVRSTIDLAHNMGREVIAEGVNNQDILDLLDILRCDYAQGFHICPPVPANELNDWLKNPANPWKLD